ncbi:MAG: hypothetical protein JWP75_361, partial [Frondihabitans sp.]|nr:hypothetical protein [Frondihabitans sp.]
WLRLSDGAVLQAPTAASAGSAIGTTDSALIPNVLLTPDVLAVGVVPPAAGATVPPAVPGAPATTTTGGSVASNPGALPSPNTH